jgi:hypothetical protein
VVFVKGDQFIVLDGFEDFLNFLVLGLELFLILDNPFWLFPEKKSNILKVEFGVKCVLKELNEV